MAAVRRKAPTQVAPQTIQEATATIDRYMAMQATVDQLKADADASIQQIEGARDAMVAPLEQAQKELFKQLGQPGRQVRIDVMTCEHIRLADGTGMIVCGTRRRPKCVQCGGRADLECDWKVPGRKSGTCDAPICSRCTTSPAPKKDLCPEHAAAWQRWKEALVHA